MAFWLIGYDITDSKRLHKVHRRLICHAITLEYSVFFLEGNQEDKDRCMKNILSLICPLEDDLRCYPLPTRGYQARIGCATLPVGIQWTGLPTIMVD